MKNHRPGQRVGKLTLLSVAGRDSFQVPIYNFKCNCGRSIVCRWKERESCGECDPPARAPRVNKRSIERRYHTSQVQAGFRKLAFDLSFELFRDLVMQPCHYCGDEPKDFHGLDRIDNSLGYVKANVVPCCRTCNMAKSDRDAQEFLDWVKKVYMNQFC